MNSQRKMLIAFAAIIAIQILDVGLHIAINEVEMLRVMSNAVLVMGVSLGVFLSPSWRTANWAGAIGHLVCNQPSMASWRTAIWAGAIGYLVLNLVFVALFGLENPVTGVNRTPLFGFMALSLWLTYRVGRLQTKAELASAG